MYKTEDYGIFLGLMTMPFGKESAFKEHEIDNLFKQYKDNVRSSFLADNEEDKIFDKYLFRPKTYGLFGNFDLAILSIVDSFSLATRSFHPFSALIEEKLNSSSKEKDAYVPNNYTFHVISGLPPNLQAIDPQEDRLLQGAEKTFLNEDTLTRLPFIGISSFKFNSALTIGGGGEFVDLALRRILFLLKEKQKKYKGRFQYLIFYSFSWHELSIVFFSDSYNSIANEVFSLRELIVEDLRITAASKAAFELLMEETLLHKTLLNDEHEQNNTKLYQAHLFVHSNTILGYDSDILIKNDKSFDDRFDEELTFRTRWDIKPGHLSAFLKDLRQFPDSSVAHRLLKRGRVTAGRGDYSYLIEENAMAEFREMMNLIINSELRKHIRKVNTTPTFGNDLRKEEGASFDLNRHYLVHDQLARYQFRIGQITILRKHLKRLRVPKIIQEKVNNMYTIFNDGISDPILYSYFIEMRPYLEEVLALIESLVKEGGNKSVKSITDQLDSITKDYEMAYQNRFGQSYIMNEITDFNLKFNGGIQQLLSLFDGAYKTLTSLFEEGEFGRSMAYVAGVSNTKSDLLSVRLNYFHLYQPVFFAATATHEAVNFVPHRYFLEKNGQDSRLNRLFAKIMHSNKELEREHLHYFFVDIITYFTTFREDFDLFYYWMWSVYIQMGIAYNVNGSMEQEGFNMLCTRLYALAKITNNESAFDGAFQPPFTPVNDSLQDSWEIALIHAKQQWKKLLEEHQDLLLDARDLAAGYLLADFVKGIVHIEEGEQLTQMTNTIKANFAAKQDQYNEINDFIINQKTNRYYTNDNFYNLLATARQYHIQMIADEVKEHFLNGRTYSFQRIRKHPHLQLASDSFFLQAVMLGYLQLMKSLNKNTISILSRSPQDGSVKNKKQSTSATHSHFWFDPFGGFFTTSTKARVTHFKLRSVFLKTLWNFSAKRKVKLFEESLHE